MNTRVNYLYRDAANYKQWHSVVLAGELTDAQRALITGALDDGDYFIAEQVGLPNLRERWRSHYDDIDHVWHELTSIDTVDDPPTVTETAATFAARFAGITWDEPAAIARLDAWIANTPPGT